MKRKPIDSRQSYFLNPVTIGLGLLLVLAGSTLWTTAPSLLVRVESNRVLLSTAQKFERNRHRYLESDEALDELHNFLMRGMYAAQVSDPEMEAWVEIDEDRQAHFGVIYDIQFHWPFGIAAPTTITVEQRHATTSK